MIVPMHSFTSIFVSLCSFLLYSVLCNKTAGDKWVHAGADLPILETGSG